MLLPGRDGGQRGLGPAGCPQAGWLSTSDHYRHQHAGHEWLEFARILRGTDKEVPFLFITGGDPALISDLSPAQLLVKPFTPEALLERVGQMATRVANPGQPA